LRRQVVLCLPMTRWCIRYANWLHENTSTLQNASVLLMREDLYTSRFSHAAASNQHTAEQQDFAVRVFGRPSANWQITWALPEAGSNR
jgi:hypothetical protein